MTGSYGESNIPCIALASYRMTCLGPSELLEVFDIKRWASQKSLVITNYIHPDFNKKINQEKVMKKERKI